MLIPNYWQEFMHETKTITVSWGVLFFIWLRGKESQLASIQMLFWRIFALEEQTNRKPFRSQLDTDVSNQASAYACNKPHM